jgi:hypothetical protein
MVVIDSEGVFAAILFVLCVGKSSVFFCTFGLIHDETTIHLSLYRMFKHRYEVAGYAVCGAF